MVVQNSLSFLCVWCVSWCCT